MSEDPYAHINSGGKIPRSARAWRELVETAHELQRKRSGLPADPASSTDFFPNLTVNVRNLSGADMLLGELVKVLPPETMGQVPAGTKLLNAESVFPAVKPDATTSSYARVLELIKPKLVGRAAVLGWVGSGSASVRGSLRRVPSQRYYAGTSVVGVPYLNTVFLNIYNYPMNSISYTGIQVPFAGIPWGFSNTNPPTTPPCYLPGLESFRVEAADKNSGTYPNRLVKFTSRYPQQFRGTFTLLFRVTRTRGPLKDQSTGRTIGYGHPGFTLNSRVEATRQGQFEPLSGTVSTTFNPLWISRHPRTFTVGQFDGNFVDTYVPQTFYSYLSQVIPFSTFNAATFNDPSKWNYQWIINCSLGGVNMPAYANGELKIDLQDCALELMETQRDETILLKGKTVQPQPTPASIADDGGYVDSSAMPSRIEGPLAAAGQQIFSSELGQRAFERVGLASMTTSSSTVSSTGSAII